MSWRLEYDPAVLKDLRRIDRQDQRFILESLDKFARDYSESYVIALLRTGRLKKLHGKWERLRRLRLRSYRVIFSEHRKRLVILIIRLHLIRHRFLSTF